MRDGMERFVVLPLFMGCVSPSSVQVFSPCPSPKQSKPESHSHTLMPTTTKRQEKDGENSLEVKNKNINSRGFYSFPKPNNIALGIHKLIVRSSKTFSQLSVEKEEEEMEIGAPTDVKHITHIGIGECASLSSSNITNNIPVETHAILFTV